jgi:long-chain acyl-CoA synthetase
MSSNYIGIDLGAIFTNDELKKIFGGFIFNKELKNKLNSFSRVLEEVKNNFNQVYVFITDIDDKINCFKLKSKLDKVFSRYNIAYDKIIYCGNDLVSAIREYRIDTIFVPISKVYDKSDDLLVSSKAKIEANYRKVYYSRVDSNILEKKLIDPFLIDYIPDYTNVIFLNNIFDCVSSDRIKFIYSIFELASAIEDCKITKNSRKEKIERSYEYIPKTGVVSRDKEWKKYWASSKFEGDFIDSQLKKKSRLDFLKFHNKFNLDSIAIEYVPLNIKITYGKLFSLVDNTCRSFLQLGIKKGDVVSLCNPNVIEDYVSMLALNHIGAIVNPLHPLVTQSEIDNIFNEVKPKYFVCFDMDDDNKINLSSLISKYDIEKVILIGKADSAEFLKKKTIDILTYITDVNREKKRYILPDSSKYIYWSDLQKLGNCYKGEIVSNHNDSDIAFYYTTGGTTSDVSKIVKLPYSLINESYYNSYGIDVAKGETVIINYLRHIAFSDANCTHLPASIGMHLIFTPLEYPSNFAKLLSDNKVSVIQVAPQFYQMMLDDEKRGSFDNVDLSSVKYIVSGGDSMDDILRKNILDFFARHNNTKVQLIVGYGCTELGGACLVQLFGTNADNKSNSIGIPLPNFEVKLLDEENKVIDDDSLEGDLLLGGEGNIMKGYLNNDSDCCTYYDDVPFYNTMDIVKYSSLDSSFDFIARKKRFLIVNNEKRSGKVLPTEIDKVILDNVKEVQSCCTIGIFKNGYTSLNVAVVLADGVFPDVSVIDKIKMVARNADELYCIDDVIFLDTLPLTQRQKVDYRKVENMFENKVMKKVLKK